MAVKRSSIKAVVNQSLVLLINICDENHFVHLVPNRWGQIKT